MFIIKSIIKFFVRLILLVVLIIGGMYAYDMYNSSQGTNRQSVAHTAVEQTIESSEDELSRTDRLKRLLNLQEGVQNALNRRVPFNDRVKSTAISESAKKALVAIEDKRFYEHGAIDPMGIARALYTNTVAGETLEGGSTITQQLVKNLFLSSKRIMSRKVEEAVMAVMMEHYYSKDDIITMYMNTIYYGHDYYGIKQAAAGYFKTTPGRLTLAQSAMLAGLPQAPSYLDPKVNFRAAKERQYIVLMQMVDQGMISKSEAESAFKEELGLPDEMDYDTYLESRNNKKLDDLADTAKKGLDTLKEITSKYGGASDSSSDSKSSNNNSGTSDSSSDSDSSSKSNADKRGDRAKGYIGE